MIDIYVDKEFGEIEIRQNFRIKRVGIAVEGEKIVLKCPIGVSKNRVVSFMDESREWIRKKIEKRESREDIRFIPGTSFKCLTFEVEYKGYGKSEVVGHIDREKGRLVVYYPTTLDFGIWENEERIKKVIMRTVEVEAKRIIPNWLSEVAKRYGLSYKDCKVRMMKTRWGSCNAEKSIHLSAELMMLPIELVEYVMVHELCHTREMNHGQTFHRLVNECVGGKEKTLDKKLKQYRPIFA